MSLRFTRLFRNIKRLDENTSIFFGKKKMSDRLSSRKKIIIDEDEEDI